MMTYKTISSASPGLNKIEPMEVIAESIRGCDNNKWIPVRISSTERPQLNEIVTKSVNTERTRSFSRGAEMWMPLSISRPQFNEPMEVDYEWSNFYSSQTDGTLSRNDEEVSMEISAQWSGFYSSESDKEYRAQINEILPLKVDDKWTFYSNGFEIMNELSDTDNSQYGLDANKHTAMELVPCIYKKGDGRRKPYRVSYNPWVVVANACGVLEPLNDRDI